KRSGGGAGRFFSGLGRVLSAIWLGIAHAVGGVVRKLGAGAREIDPEHRRDGVGLAVLAAAIVVAAAVWWNISGAVGDGIRIGVNRSVGVVGWALPVLLF